MDLEVPTLEGTGLPLSTVTRHEDNEYMVKYGTIPSGLALVERALLNLGVDSNIRLNRR